MVRRYTLEESDLQKTPDRGATTATRSSAAAPESERAWFAEETDTVVAELQTDLEAGLSTAEVQLRRERFGPNQIGSEPPPSTWTIALLQLRDPMNLMLIAVAVVSMLINQRSVGILVAVLVVLNVVLGTQQERKARASVDALATMQTP